MNYLRYIQCWCYAQTMILARVLVDDYKFYKHAFSARLRELKTGELE